MINLIQVPTTTVVTVVTIFLLIKIFVLTVVHLIINSQIIQHLTPNLVRNLVRIHRKNQMLKNHFPLMKKLKMTGY